MKTAEDIESYLLMNGAPYEQIKPGIWLVRLEGGQSLAISMAGPVVAFRLKVMDLPSSDRESLYRTLLSLNTTEMVHGSFGLEGDAVVMVDALELENLDGNELQAVIDEFSMALTKHFPTLARWSGHAAPAAGARAMT